MSTTNLRAATIKAHTGAEYVRSSSSRMPRVSAFTDFRWYLESFRAASSSTQCTGNSRIKTSYQPFNKSALDFCCPIILKQNIEINSAVFTGWMSPTNSIKEKELESAKPNRHPFLIHQLIPEGNALWRQNKNNKSMKECCQNSKSNF